jgi:hypothetical protein
MVLIGAATTFAAAMFLLLTENWLDNPDVSFGRVVRTLLLISAALVAIRVFLI